MTIHLIILYAAAIMAAVAFFSVYFIGMAIGGNAKKSLGEGVDAVITIAVLAIVVDFAVCLVQLAIEAVGA